MSDTLRSILCGEQFWCWDEEGGNTITFHKNGTGEVRQLHLNVAGPMTNQPQSCNAVPTSTSGSAPSSTGRATNRSTKSSTWRTILKKGSDCVSLDCSTLKLHSPRDGLLCSDPTLWHTAESTRDSSQTRPFDPKYTQSGSRKEISPARVLHRGSQDSRFDWFSTYRRIPLERSGRIRPWVPMKVLFGLGKSLLVGLIRSW